jgi:hypothetical protein
MGGRLMTIQIEIHHHHDSPRDSAQLRRIEDLLITLGERILSALDSLKTNVANNTTVIQSAIVLIQGLKQKLDDAIASGDPAQVQALSDELGAQDAALAQAVAANTPAAPDGSSTTTTDPNAPPTT